MKIEGNRTTGDTDAAAGAEGARRADRGSARPAERNTAGGQDTVAVSPDARLLAEALKGAGESPAIRSDVVEAMKQKLAAGEIGSDSGRLADRIIDDLLGEP